jgi:hypothetical protein
MTSAQIRLRRLARLLALARADALQAERALANANQTVETATVRQQGIARIISETEPPIGQSARDRLSAGAQLRLLLLPAAGAAEAARAAGLSDRAAAEARLRGASARADSLADRLMETRRLCAAETERREADRTPAQRIRR